MGIFHQPQRHGEGQPADVLLHAASGRGATAAANISGDSAAARESWDCSEVGTPCHFWSRKGVLDVHPLSMT